MALTAAARTLVPHWFFLPFAGARTRVFPLVVLLGELPVDNELHHFQIVHVVFRAVVPTPDEKRCAVQLVTAVAFSSSSPASDKSMRSIHDLGPRSVASSGHSLTSRSTSHICGTVFIIFAILSRTGVSLEGLLPE